jgi:TatD DNase family protein
MLPIVDTHCHYNLEPLLRDWTRHWQAAQEAAVVKSIVVGTSQVSNQSALDIAATSENLLVALGYHPNEYTRLVETTADLEVRLTQLEQLLPHPKVVAIGETGLDYFRLDTYSVEQILQIKQLQQTAFKAQLTLAQTHQLPLIIHVRDTHLPEERTTGNAYWDVLSILEKEWQGSQPFILHCVSGPVRYVQTALELGAYLGIAGNITYKNADHLRSLVKLAPSDRLLLETDAPYLPPHPHRGQPCQPAMIRLTADFVSEELGCNLDQIYQNTLNCFSRLTQ